MGEQFDLGVTDLRPLRSLDLDRWAALRDRLHRPIFLRSEGTVVELDAPQEASGRLLADCRELVARFDRFYAAAAAAYHERPDLRPEFLPNPILDPLIAIDRAARTPTPLARLDCVLGADGSLRVIEINSVGVNLLHIRSLLYLVRGLWRDGQEAAARDLDSLSQVIVATFDRYYRAHAREPVERPTVGALAPNGWFRAMNRLLRAAFERGGCGYTYGGPDALEVDARGVKLAGRRVDLLWPDFLFYLGYQHTRYAETRFPSALGNYSETPAQTAALLGNEVFLEHLRARRVVHISPASAYLVLPKSLLAWIHDRERPVPEADRQWLADHVARTYALRERRAGVLGKADVLDRPERFLVKPCQYGGSHGVMLGRDASRTDWIAAVERMWDDEQWVVQDYWEPVHTAAGEWLSLGVQNHGGELGGIYLRTSPTAIVSARRSKFIPVVGDGR